MEHSFDLIVIGSGPAGQKAAIQASKEGKRVLLIEQEREVGGACVQHGTIPSKTLRETAAAIRAFPKKTGGVFVLPEREDLTVGGLMLRKEQVIDAHQQYIERQLKRNHIEQAHGRAQFLDAHRVEIQSVKGARRVVSGEFIVIATGSRPRSPANIPIDHEFIVDSDSLLSMLYLPKTLIVLGGGVIACEYASIFAALGVEVTMVDGNPRPLPFLDPELTSQFVTTLERSHGRFLGNTSAKEVYWDGVSQVHVTLQSGEHIQAEKLFCALGRVANIESLHVDAAGVNVSSRGFIEVDAHCRTNVEHIYAVGDVAGPPSLASAAMEQGRRAMRHALKMPSEFTQDYLPTGVYTIPEMSSVGLTEEQARQKYGAIAIGRARFSEIARGHIASEQDGLLKIVTTADGGQILGVHVVGDNAA
jgi:NAD(P) transhydrogenase